jgi:hypothetical protein
MFVPWQRMIPDSSSAEQRRSIVGEHAYRATPSPASPLTPGKLSYIFLRRPQLSFGRRFSRQSRNAALTAAIPQIGSHRQTTSIGANRISPAIFFCARRHRRDKLVAYARPWLQTVVVDSNHDNWLMRWLRKHDYRLLQTRPTECTAFLGGTTGSF